jgi:hypothetical protein
MADNLMETLIPNMPALIYAQPISEPGERAGRNAHVCSWKSGIKKGETTLF